MSTADEQPHVHFVTPKRRLRHLTHVSGFNLVHVQQKQPPTAVYFTFHDDPDHPAFYTSEKCINVVSPKWRRFNVSQFKEGTSSALSHMLVRVWASNDVESLIFDCNVIFSSLVYLGPQIPKSDQKFMPNTLVFGMQEGYYAPAGTYKSNLKANDEKFSFELPIDGQMVHKSYDISTVKRIHMIQRAMKQTQASIWKYRNRIQELLTKTTSNEEERLTEEYLRMSVHFLKEELQAQKIKLVIEHDRFLKLKCKMDEKAKTLETNMRQLHEAKERFQENYNLFTDKRELLLKTNAELQMRRRHLVSELSCIYPIREVDDQINECMDQSSSSRFSCLSQSEQELGKGVTICGVLLPNSEDFSGHDETRIAVALGYVLHVVSMVAQFLDVPLRYSVNNSGSRSTIKDHIMLKIPNKEREFPLFTKGREKLHFNYGVFLLNKNIAQLRYYCGMLTQDLRPTLPNLLELQQKMKFDSLPSGSLLLGPSRQLALSAQDGVPTSPKRLMPSSAEHVKRARSFFPKIPQSAPQLGADEYLLNSVLLDMQASCYQDHLSPSAVNATLSYSLDKGLDELNVHSKSLGAGVYLHPRMRGMQWHPKSVHTHGSEPNLVQHQVARTKAETNGERDSENGAKFFKPSSEMWATGSSQANSEEEVLRASSDSVRDGFLYPFWKESELFAGTAEEEEETAAFRRPKCNSNASEPCCNTDAKNSVNRTVYDGVKVENDRSSR